MDLGPGLTVVTGETGAGKTMVVTSLSLLFGGRADAGAVRPGAAAAVVEGTVRVRAGSPVAAAGPRGRRRARRRRRRHRGAAAGPQPCAAEGRSRAHVGGRAVPVAVLAELAERPDGAARAVRPAAAAPARACSAPRSTGSPAPSTPRPSSALRGRLPALAGDGRRRSPRSPSGRRERAQEADLLRLGLAEIDEVAPRAGRGRRARRRDPAARPRRRAADRGRTGPTTRSPGSWTAGRRCRRRRPGRGGRAGCSSPSPSTTRRWPRWPPGCRRPPTCSPTSPRTSPPTPASVDADPLRLAAAQDRRAALTALTRKYGDDVDAVLAWAAARAARLGELDGDDDRLDEPARRGGRAAPTRWPRWPASVSAPAGRGRSGSSARPSPSSWPRWRCRTPGSASPCAGGPPRPGAVGRPRRRPPVAVGRGRGGRGRAAARPAPRRAGPARSPSGASGGELSRVMLALEVVLAGADPVATMVFDEVDAGVGGAAAVEVGRRLARLARDHQVIVVTHLPQVAAFADHHLLVEKASDGVGHPVRRAHARPARPGPRAQPDARRPGRLRARPGPRRGAARRGRRRARRLRDGLTWATAAVRARSEVAARCTQRHTRATAWWDGTGVAAWQDDRR